MLRRLFCAILILTLLCAEIPAAFAEEMEIIVDEVAVDVVLTEGGDGFDEDEADTAEGYTTLKRGDRDGDDSSAVVVLQTRLVELGYLRDSADGVFGGNTEEAVCLFQRVHGIAETGAAGPDTQELLFNGTNLTHFADSDLPESVAYRVERTLAKWGFVSKVPNGVINTTKGDAIPDFKTYLRSYLRLNPTPAPEATLEPSPTPMPEGFADAAVVIDQPIVKDETQDITQELLDFVDGKYEFNVYTRTVSNGDEDFEVFRVQRRLYDLKYLAIANGIFDENTERALLYFQKKNGLPLTAVADEATQRLLFSDAAAESEEYVNAYKYVIDISDQKVLVYQWNGSSYTTCVREMICSTGTKANPTPLGTFQAAGPTGTGQWYYFKEYECYAKWATRIVGGILFHSVTYSKGKSLNRTSVRKLGRRASHGCIRLQVEDADWVYQHCPPGTTVVIQD